MTNRYKSIMAMLALGVLFASCQKDNYAEPKTSLTGNIVYQGQPIGVEYSQTRLQLWQPGFGKTGAIDVAIDQNGSYSALLFDGSYKLVIPKSEGPWKSIINAATGNDTTLVTLNGNQQLDIEVLPYYVFKTATISGGEKKVNATVALDKIITGADAKDVERVSLYVSKTMFVSRANNISSKDMNGADITDLGNFSISADVPSITPTQNYVFARVGIKIAGVEDMLFSKVEKITY